MASMNLDQFIHWAQSQNGGLLFAPSRQREPLRGECVQLVSVYVTSVLGKNVIWDDAAGWWYDGRLQNEYQRVAFNGHNRPPRGAVVVFSKSLPGSGGKGHIDICLSAPAGAPTWIGLDQNWGGKTPHQVTHNWSYVLGWLVPKGAKPAPKPVPKPRPVPQPAPKGGDEMIVNADQATKMYRVLRPNGSPSKAEINATVCKRTFAGFLNDAQTEVKHRDAALANQREQLGKMQGTINNQNKVITDLTNKLTDATTTAAEKQAALTEALQQIAADNAEMATSHNTITDLDKQVSVDNNAPVVQEPADVPAEAPQVNASPVGKFIAAILTSFGKFKKAE